MNILNLDTKYNLNFNATSDITLRYILEKRSQYLPERVLEAVKTAEAKSGINQPTLKELHNDVYQKLFDSKSLEEAKELYPEFSDIINITEFEGNRSKALKAIKAIMPLKDFTLQYLKDLYLLITEDNLVKKYGFSNRSLLIWLNQKLHIKKPNGEYNILVKMTDEAENNKVAEFSRQRIKNNPEAHRAMSKKGAEAQKHSDVAEKKRQQMKAFYQTHPQYAEKTKIISTRTWEKCPEIKRAFSEYTSIQNDITRKILEKRIKNKQDLTENEEKIIAGYYKKFWEMHPEYLIKYSDARKEAIEELTKEGLISKLGLDNSGGGM